MRRHVVATVVVVLLGVVAITGTQLAGADPAPSSAPTQTEDQLLMRSAAAPSEVRSTFAVLASVGNRAVNQAVNERVWTNSTARGGCVWHQSATELGPGGSCFNSETLLQGNAWNISGDQESGFQLTALIPDAAATATVQFVDGSSKQVSVIDNTIYLKSAVNVSGYRYATRGMERQISASGYRG